MNSFSHTSDTKDFTNRIAIDVPQNTVNIVKEEPYGFWRITMNKGTTPKMLRGSFTSHVEARKAVERWVNSNRHLKILSEREE